VQIAGTLIDLEIINDNFVLLYTTIAKCTEKRKEFSFSIELINVNFISD